MTTDSKQREVNEQVAEAVQAAGIAVKSWNGPRSTEIGFETANGDQVTLSVHVKERIV